MAYMAEVTLELLEEEVERLEWACKIKGFHSLDECIQEAIRALIARYKSP